MQSSKRMCSRHFSVFQWQNVHKYTIYHDNRPESSFQGDENLIKIAHPSIKSYEASHGFSPIFFTFPVWGDCDEFCPSNSSVFYFFQVLRAKKAAFKIVATVSWIPWIVLGFFWYLKRTWKRALVSAWFSNFGQNLVLVDLQKLGKSHEKLCLPFNSRKTSGK